MSFLIYPTIKQAPILGMLGLGGGIARGGAAVNALAAAGAVYAFSGDNTTTDETGNGNSIVSYNQFSTTQKKWGSYSHSFQSSGDTWSDRLAFPTWTPSSTGWSFEFWLYPTSWAGKYALHFGNGSLSINVQTSQFRFYNNFSGGVSYDNQSTNSYLNQWNFFQAFYDGTNTKFRINASERGSISGNIGSPTQVVLGNKVSSETFGTNGFWNDIIFYNGVNRGAQSVPSTPFGL